MYQNFSTYTIFQIIIIIFHYKNASCKLTFWLHMFCLFITGSPMSACVLLVACRWECSVRLPWRSDRRSCSVVVGVCLLRLIGVSFLVPTCQHSLLLLKMFGLQPLYCCFALFDTSSVVVVIVYLYGLNGVAKIFPFIKPAQICRYLNLLPFSQIHTKNLYLQNFIFKLSYMYLYHAIPTFFSDILLILTENSLFHHHHNFFAEIRFSLHHSFFILLHTAILKLRDCKKSQSSQPANFY